MIYALASISVRLSSEKDARRMLGGYSEDALHATFGMALGTIFAIRDAEKRTSTQYKTSTAPSPKEFHL